VTPTATGLTVKNPALAYLAGLPDQGRIEFESLGDFTNRYSPVQSISATEITMAQPAWVAIRAATSLVRIPPEE
ncbi:MAG: hypothetical protein J0H67_16315, partial [Rhodospirillales bacterium]|nr:hypothetical protein [Rhodospirillales bacterium]